MERSGRSVTMVNLTQEYIGEQLQETPLATPAIGGRVPFLSKGAFPLSEGPGAMLRYCPSYSIRLLEVFSCHHEKRFSCSRLVLVTKEQ